MRNMPQIPAAYAHYSNARSIARLHRREDKGVVSALLIAGLLVLSVFLLFAVR